MAKQMRARLAKKIIKTFPGHGPYSEGKWLRAMRKCKRVVCIHKFRLTDVKVLYVAAGLAYIPGNTNMVMLTAMRSWQEIGN